MRLAARSALGAEGCSSTARVGVVLQSIQPRARRDGRRLSIRVGCDSSRDGGNEIDGGPTRDMLEQLSDRLDRLEVG